MHTRWTDNPAPPALAVTGVEAKNEVILSVQTTLYEFQHISTEDL